MSMSCTKLQVSYTYFHWVMTTHTYYGAKMPPTGKIPSSSELLKVSMCIKYTHVCNSMIRLRIMPVYVK